MVTKEELEKYNKAYMDGKPLISDAEWDRLQEEYVREHGESSRMYSRREQTESVNNLVCTLGKVYGVTTTMRPDQVSYRDWIHKNNIDEMQTIIVQPKFDGCSIAMDCNENRWFKRGDYDNGISDEVTDLFYDSKFPEYDRIMEIDDGVKFEYICPVGNHYVDEYYTPRDQAAAFLQKKDPRHYECHLIPLRELCNGKQYVAGPLCKMSKLTHAGDYVGIQNFIDDILEQESSVYQFQVYEDLNYTKFQYKCDGVVVSVINPDKSIAKEVAIKIIFDVNETKLLDVKYQMGLTGKVTPVAIVEPTSFMDGKRTVTHIGLSNIDRVKKMELRYNDTVKVMYNIVPYLIESKHDGELPIPIPQKCPICGSKWDTSVLEVRCTNLNCDSRRIGDITRYVIQMRMKGLALTTIRNLYDNGLIKTISDLYTLKSEDIQRIDGYGKISADEIVNTIHKSSIDVPIAQWLGALPFENISRKTWDLLLTSAFGNDEMNKANMMIDYIEMEPYEFTNEILSNDYKGIGEVTRNIMETTFIRLINEMRKILPYITFKTTTKNPHDVKGYITFTGCRPTEGDCRFLGDKGYEIIDFGAKTTHLIIPKDGYENNKTKKCRDRNIPIITYEHIDQIS